MVNQFCIDFLLYIFSNFLTLRILKNITFGDKFIYVPNDVKQNNPFCRFGILTPKHNFNASQKEQKKFSGRNLHIRQTDVLTYSKYYYITLSGVYEVVCVQLGPFCIKI